jgi:glucan phosphorylase
VSDLTKRWRKGWVEFYTEDEMYTIGNEMATKLEAVEAREEARRKGIVALADHIQETVDAPWTGEPFKDIEDCDGSWKSLIEHEVSELRALAASEPPPLDRYEQE